MWCINRRILPYIRLHMCASCASTGYYHISTLLLSLLKQNPWRKNHASDEPRWHCLKPNTTNIGVCRCNSSLRCCCCNCRKYTRTNALACLDVGADAVLDGLQVDRGRCDHHLRVAGEVSAFVQYLDLCMHINGPIESRRAGKR